MTPTQPRLFNVQSRDAIRRAQASVWIPLLAGTTILMGFLFGVIHHEIPFVDFALGNCDSSAAAVDCATRFATSVSVGAVATLVFAGLSVWLYLKRPIRPTVTCENCGGVGWVMDLESFNGQCPHCGRDQFTYQTGTVQPDPVHGAVPHRVLEHHMKGGDLIERYHATRKSSMNRFY
jgi:hypothetical protein